MFEYNNVQNRDRYSVPQRLALPASNVAAESVFNLDFSTLYVLHRNKELIL